MGQFKSFHCSFISLFGGLRIRIGYLLAGDAGLVCSGCLISGLVSGSVVCSSEVVDCCCLAVIVSSLSSASGIAGVGLTVTEVDCGNLFSCSVVWDSSCSSVVDKFPALNR